MKFLAVRHPPVHPRQQAVQGENLANDLYVRRSLEVEQQLVPLKNTPFVIGDITRSENVTVFPSSVRSHPPS